MLITKFNRMIRNKLIWAGFAVLVSIAFVGTFSQGSGCSESEHERGTVGMLYGKDISAREFSMARFFALGMRESRNLSPEAHRIIRGRTWKRLTALKTAEKLGLSTSDQEIVEVIRQDPNFAVNSVFNKHKYKAVVQSQFRVSIPLFEEFLRREITMQKLVGMLESAVWMPPAELKQKLISFTDSFVVEYAMLDADDLVGEANVAIEDAERFFNKNREFFTIPENVNVRYVAFPISNYLSEINIKDEDILKYYTNHLEEYSIPHTNNEISSLPIEEVRADIVTVLQHESATFDAKDKATGFVVDLTPDRYGNAPSMKETALKYGLTIYTSEFFSATEDVPDLKVNRNFNNAAFELDPSDPERYFSDAVTGEDAVYVIAANDRLEAHIPNFSEVIDDVMPLARDDAKDVSFLEKSWEIKNSVEHMLQSGKTFEDALKNFNINVNTTITFTAYEILPEDIEYFDVLIPNVISIRKGELTDPLVIENGALLAYVVDRQPGDLASMEFVKSQIISTVDRYRAGIIFEEWQNYMLAKAGFKDLMFPAEGDEIEAE